MTGPEVGTQEAHSPTEGELGTGIALSFGRLEMRL